MRTFVSLKFLPSTGSPLYKLNDAGLGYHRKSTITIGVFFTRISNFFEFGLRVCTTSRLNWNSMMFYEGPFLRHEDIARPLAIPAYAPTLNLAHLSETFLLRGRLSRRGLCRPRHHYSLHCNSHGVYTTDRTSGPCQRSR